MLYKKTIDTWYCSKEEILFQGKLQDGFHEIVMTCYYIQYTKTYYFLTTLIFNYIGYGKLFKWEYGMKSVIVTSGEGKSIIMVISLPVKQVILYINNKHLIVSKVREFTRN